MVCAHPLGLCAPAPSVRFGSRPSLTSSSVQDRVWHAETINLPVQSKIEYGIPERSTIQFLTPSAALMAPSKRLSCVSCAPLLCVPLAAIYPCWSGSRHKRNASTSSTWRRHQHSLFFANQLISATAVNACLAARDVSPR